MGKRYDFYFTIDSNHAASLTESPQAFRTLVWVGQAGIT
jgi:hypothetical protein